VYRNGKVAGETPAEAEGSPVMVTLVQAGAPSIFEKEESTSFRPRIYGAA
jgi:hypothetical protein